MWLLFEISLPHLAQYRLRTALTVLGISLGVAAIVATSTVADAVFGGFRRAVEATAGRADLHLTNSGLGVAEEVLAGVRETRGVAAASPLVEGFVTLASDDAAVVAIFGLDLLGDDEHESQLPRDAVEIDDDLVFVSQSDSVAIPRHFAAARGFAMGSKLEVVAPGGIRTLVVRGLIDPVGPATLFDGMVGLMDLPAAQRLLGKEGRVDRIDIRVEAEAEKVEIHRLLSDRFQVAGRVDESTIHGARAETILFALRVTLGIAGLLAATVGVFLIYHTVAVSISQRRREIAILNSLGVTRLSLIGWLLAEAMLMGVAACVIGTAVGVLLAHLATSIFGSVVSAWVVLQPERPSLAPGTVLLAGLTGVATSIIATIVPACAAAWQPLDVGLKGERRTTPVRRVLLRSAALCLGGLALCLAALAVAPRQLGYGALVSYVFAACSLALLSIAALAPAANFLVGWLASRIARRRRGLALLLAGGTILRNPVAPAAVVVAMVVGLGWNLANGAVVRSFQSSFLGWLDEHYRSDLVVSGGGSAASLLTLPPIRHDVIDALRELPGVQSVQGLRMVEADYAGRPIVLQALDRTDVALPLLEGQWADIEGDFWAGRGALVSENLAHKTGLTRGGTMALASPSGEQALRILGVFTDFGGGDLGSVTLSRSHYHALWHDTLVSRIRIWLAPGADARTVRADVQRVVGPRGLGVVTAEEFRGAARELYVDNAFALNYAIILIAALISFVAVANFFLSAALDRAAELNVLGAVGVTPRQIRAALLAEGALLGIVGVALGLIAGAVVSRIIVRVAVPMVTGWHLRYAFPFDAALQACVGVMLLAMLAGWAPRTRAATSGRAVLE
jgi:putative ABC transport system permease protein